MIHDPVFLRTANLDSFNMEIANAGLAHENEFFLSLLLLSLQGSIFLDVGAFNGDTCIPVAQMLSAKGRGDVRVVAFEPSEARSGSINAVAKKEGLNLRCENTAISDALCTLYMKKDEGPGTMYDVDFAGVAVPATSLDSFSFDEVALIKLDVEGHEDIVLKGAQKTLACTRNLYVEMWNDDHFKRRHPTKQQGSHNKRILDLIPNALLPRQKMEKNIFFQRDDEGGRSSS